MDGMDTDKAVDQTTSPHREVILRRMAEYELNVNFVQEIEKYPCLYNFRLPEYSRKDAADKAWKEIGDKFNLSGAECKEKWKNLRSVFVRHLKPAKNKYGSSLKRPYYLNDYMQFTLPFIKATGINTRTATSEIKPSDDSSYVSPTLEPQTLLIPRDCNDSEESSCHSNFFERRQSMSEPQAKIARIEIKREDSNSDLDVSDPIRTPQENEHNDDDISQETANKMFLLSMVPDMNRMTDRQRRDFKRRLLCLVDDILDPATDALHTDTNFYNDN